jgi:Zn-dependent protease
VFGRSWRLGSIGGIAIRIDSSWAIMAVLVTYSLWLRFTFQYKELENLPAFGLAVFAAALFFGSVLVHELAHAGMARARGIAVSGITLFLFGGATSARVEDRGPGDEFLITAVGPGSSLALAGGFWALAAGVDSVGGRFDEALRYVAGVNLILAGFNLVPGFPLDGGRILRSVIWKVTGSLERATRVAAWSGQVVGALLIAVGVVAAVRNDLPLAVWMALIGWFLLRAARSAVYQQQLRGFLARGLVGEAMAPSPPAVPAELSLSDSLDRYLAGNEQAQFPVVDGERLVGVLTFDSARRIGRDDPLRPVREAMLPLSKVTTVDADEPLDRVIEQLSDGGSALVVRDGRLVGSISAADVSRWARTRGA